MMRVSGNKFCLMSVADALQEADTRGQLSLTDSSRLDTQLSAPGFVWSYNDE